MHSRNRVALFAGALALMLASASIYAASPVADAAMRGDADAVRTLVRQGADVNAPQGDGMTALHWAALNGDLKISDVLLVAGAGTESLTRNGGYTPLHLASSRGHASVVARLLEGGSKPKAVTATGVQAIHLAAQAGSADAVRFLIDRGAVPERFLDPASRAAANPQGVVSITGVWRTPDPPGAFTPAPDRARHIWYSRDVAGIAAANGLELAAPVVIDADATPNPGGWPRGGQTVVEFRNQHLSYAVTWFGLAVCLLGVWLAFHISRGRLAWSKP
jgi:ankyrin repeat protein